MLSYIISEILSTKKTNNKKPRSTYFLNTVRFPSRSDKTWTCGLYFPKVALYHLSHTPKRKIYYICAIIKSQVLIWNIFNYKNFLNYLINFNVVKWLSGTDSHCKSIFFYYYAALFISDVPVSLQQNLLLFPGMIHQDQAITFCYTFHTLWNIPITWRCSRFSAYLL